MVYDPRILAGIPQADQEKLIEFHDADITKALGVVWEPKSDHLQFSNIKRNFCSVVTKRTVLADMASIFDPLGLINPIVVLAKIFLQELWILGLDWDESLPQKLHEQWQTFRSQLDYIVNLKFPRFVLIDSKPVLIELHGFADASQRAYGTAVYVRSVDNAGNIRVRLLCAKSRVAPVRTISLPRLELCGALMCIELISRLRSMMQNSIDRVFCWTDSTIVLDWLSSHASTWTPFVSHRVAKIQEMSSAIIWNHVDTKNNPADVVSRGMLPEKLAQCELWFNGPPFLQQYEESWPKPRRSYAGNIDIPEKRKSNFKILTVGQNTTDILQNMKYINDFGVLRRILAYVLRFIHNLQRSHYGQEKLAGQL